MNYQPTTTSSAPPSRATTRPARRCGRSWSQRATSISASMPAGTRCATRRFYGESELDDARRWPQNRADRRRGRVGRGAVLFLPALGLAGPAAGVLRGTTRLHRAGEPRATRSSASSRAGCRTSRCRAPASAGACRCRTIPTHIMYVWLDALTNYITACRLSRHRTRTAMASTGRPTCTWSARTSCASMRVFWPAFLMAAGLAPPKRVFAHGWWTNEGQKISKSLGNVIDPIALVETLRPRPGALLPAARGAVRQ